jgi:hypothetical protein
MRRSLVLALCSFALSGAMVAHASAGTVEGTVTPVIWAQEVEVCLVQEASGRSCVVPGGSGSYAFPGLEGNIKLEFDPTYRSRMLTQFYNGKSTLAEAKFISVPHEGTLIGINANLVEGGVVAGQVTAAVGGEPLSEVEVCAVSVAASPVKSCSETDVNGEYELHSLPTGNYRVGSVGRGASAEYAPWYYNGGSTLAQAAPVLVTAGATTTIEPALVSGAQVRGEVTTAAGGASLEGIPVCLFVSGASAADRCTESGPAGEYSLRGIPAGFYQVGFALGSAAIGGAGSAAGFGGFLPQFYDRVASRAEAQTLLLSGPQVVTGVDAALATPTVTVPTAQVPPASNIVAAPPTISEPLKVQPLRCKKAYVKKKVKSVEKCVKAKQKKKKKTKKSHSKAKKKRGKRAGKAGPK